jgi:hypothetical protein
LSIAKIHTGQPLPLRLNAFDGNTGLFPRAILRDATDAIIATVDLSHVGDGLYKNDAQTFPATTLVTAVYKVYSDAGHTLLDQNYQDMLDVFLLEDAIASPGTVQIVERIEARLTLKNRVAATLVTPKILGVVKKSRVTAQLAQPKILGVIRQSQKIYAMLKEC